jgi:hypothetical protein
MATSRFTLAVLSITVLSISSLNLACKKTSEEDRVKEVVRAALSAANEKNVGDVLEAALPSFRGPRDATLEDCRRILLGYFMGQGWIRGFERELTVKVDGARAVAELDTLIAKGNEVKNIEDVVPTNASRLVFTIDLEKHEDAWKFARASYVEKAF